MLIKVCGMRNRENIAAISNLKPEMMGFIFYNKSKRYVGDNFNPEIVNSIRPSINTVGVFVNEIQESIIKKIKLYKFNYVQLHGTESPDYCQKIRIECKVIKSFGIHDKFEWSTVVPYQEVCDYFLFDTGTKEFGGSGIKFNWNNLDNYQLSKPFFLSGGIGKDDAEKIKNLENPYLAGIDINSKFEKEPGLKDTELLKSFIYDFRKSPGKQ